MNGIINRVAFEIGYKCPNKCDYCFQQPLKGVGITLDVNAASNFILKLAKDGLLADNFTIMLMGGETLLYLDWIKKFTKQIGDKYPVCITTSGTMLNKNVRKTLIDLGLRPTISIDGSYKVQEYHRKGGRVSFIEVRKYLQDCKKNNIITLCQSTFTPQTIGGMFESYMFISALGFDRWWYELECLSDIGYRKWSKPFQELYKNQLSLIMRAKRDIPSLSKIVDLDPILELRDHGRVQNNKVLVTPDGNIQYAPVGILRLPLTMKSELYVGDIYCGIDFDWFEKLQCFGNYPTSMYKPECNSCQLNDFCNLCLGELGEVQDESNCFWWKELIEAYDKSQLPIWD